MKNEFKSDQSFFKNLKIMNILKLTQVIFILMLISNLELTERKKNGLLSSLDGTQKHLESLKGKKQNMGGMTGEKFLLSNQKING